MSKNLVGMQVTLTSAATAYCLYDLMAAIDSTVPVNYCYIHLQADLSTNPVLVGDSAISATRYGYKINNGGATGAEATVEWHTPANNISIKDIYLWGITTASLKVNVLLIAM